MPDKKSEKETKPRYFGDVNSSLRENNFIIGWAWDSENPATPQNIELYIDGNLSGSIIANLFREDLVKSSRNGNQGFSFSAPAGTYDDQHHMVQIRIMDTDCYFPDMPKKILFPYPHHVKVEFQKYKNKLQLREDKLQEQDYNKINLEQEKHEIEQELQAMQTKVELIKKQLKETKYEKAQIQKRLDKALIELTTAQHTVQHMEKILKENQSVFDEIETMLEEAH